MFVQSLDTPDHKEYAKEPLALQLTETQDNKRHSIELSRSSRQTNGRQRRMNDRHEHVMTTRSNDACLYFYETHIGYLVICIV
jgi:hypothetical protein